MGPVSSEPGAQHRSGLIKQPLDLELPVVAMGARPGDTSEKRELFTEATETVLVFENGCVIALAAAVAIGQLVFLTNKQTGKEIVTQVLRKRSFRPTDCYVELEFTEPAADFWGVEFPDIETPLKISVEEGSGAAAVADAEVTEEDTQQVVAPPDAAEVERLRKEVEVLKAQLKSLTPTQDFIGQKEEAKPETKEPAPQEPKEEAKPEQAETQPSAPPAPTPAAAATDSGSYPIRMQLPKADPNAEASAERSGEFAADVTALAAVHAAENQLPEPSLDFERFPGIVKEKTKLFSGKATRSLSGPIGALVAVVLLFVAAGILTYRMGWLPKFGGKSSKSDPGKSAFGTPAGTTTGSEATAPNNVNSANNNAAVGEITQPNMENKTASSASNAIVEPPKVGTSSGTPVPPKKTESRYSVSPGNKRSGNVKTTGQESPAEVPPAQDGVVIPPKLVKAIKSLSPPEALRGYVSGTVTLDALVDETGHVQSSTPLAGPKALYAKAMDTVKEYLYQPATKNGKPVPAHVEVKIQFWYEP